MAKSWLTRKHSGQMLVEVMVGMAMAAMLMPAVITAFFAMRGGAGDQAIRTMALGRVREAKEIINLIKQDDWEKVAVNGNFMLQNTASVWSLTSGDEQIGELTRRITIASGYRDVTGKLALAGINDPSTKRITVTVSWVSDGITKNEQADYYIMRLENLPYIETTVADFNRGTTSGTTVTDTGGGAVTLGAGGGGNWCTPALTMTAYDLPKSGAANSVSAIEGRVFAGTGDNASGVSFANLSVDKAVPPNVSLLGTFDGYKTNEVFGENNYAYLATDTNSREVVIVNLTTNPYSLAGYYDAPVNGSGETVYVVGTVGYVLVGSKLYSFNLTAKTGSRPGLGSVSLAGTGKGLYVNNGYAYVATSSTSAEFQIIDVSNPSSMKVLSTLNVTGDGGVDVYANQTGTRAFLATNGSSSKPEFFIIDTTNKSAPAQLGSYDTSGMSPTGIRVATFNRAIVVGYGGAEYQVVDISNENNPVICGTGLNIDSGIRDIDTVFTADSAYSYVVTGDATQELRIIEGGPGGQYSTEGIFTSGIFDASHSAMFNRFDVETNIPPQTTIKYQLAVAEELAGSCNGANYSYVGPDMTGSSFFTGSSQIPLGTAGSYTNPGRCMRYKAYLTTSEGTVAPDLLTITFNYSP